ncbi:MAG: hypothetical protein LBI37_00350 [Puniceicoccales bacterium]|jgi:hypothetical protein|nr:hypothetical protein [Puniceicoccales bacterium]
MKTRGFTLALIMGFAVTCAFGTKHKGHNESQGFKDTPITVALNVMEEYLKYFGGEYCNTLTQRKAKTMDRLMDLYVNPEKIKEMEKIKLSNMLGEIQSRVCPCLRALDSANHPSSKSLFRQINLRTEYLFLAMTMVLMNRERRSDLDNNLNYWVEYFDKDKCNKYITLDELIVHVKKLTKKIERLEKGQVKS